MAVVKLVPSSRDEGDSSRVGQQQRVVSSPRREYVGRPTTAKWRLQTAGLVWSLLLMDRCLHASASCSLSLFDWVATNISSDDDDAISAGTLSSQIALIGDNAFAVDDTNTWVYSWALGEEAYFEANWYALNPCGANNHSGLLGHPTESYLYTFCEHGSSQVVDILDYTYSEAKLNYGLDSFSVVFLPGDEKDLVVDSAISVDDIFAVVGSDGGVRRLLLSDDREEITSEDPYVNKAGSTNVTSAVFSPDGQTLYTATAGGLMTSVRSDDATTNWFINTDDGDLSDIAISPDGWSVYAVGRGNSVIYGIHLDGEGGIGSINSFADSEWGWSYYNPDPMFIVGALDEVVLAARTGTDEIAVFQRANETGQLTFEGSESVSYHTKAWSGNIAGLAISSTSRRLVVTMAGGSYSLGGIAVFDVECTTPAPTPGPTPSPTVEPSIQPTPAPTLAPTDAPAPLMAQTPTPSPTRAPTPAPTAVPSMALLSEARLSAAVDGVDLIFELRGVSSGLYCYEEACFGNGACNVSALLDDDTEDAVGNETTCTWKADKTATVTFGTDHSLEEGDVVTLDPTSGYLSGCVGCEQYTTGSATVQARTEPPELSSAYFKNTGAQIVVEFSGNPSSQEIDGNYGAVSCEEVFSSDSASSLGVGSTCQFVSDSSLKATLGVGSSITASSESNCTDGDGISLTLKAGVIRTEIGAFLTTAAGCVVVDYPSDPDPPFVAISAPDAVGNCDDLILEGSASFTSLENIGVRWDVTVEGDDQSVDITDASNVTDQASNGKNLTVIIPSDYLAQGFSFSFGLTVTTELGGSGEASVTVFKSLEGLPALKVVGSSSLQRTRASPTTIYTETKASSCATVESGQEQHASYTWTVLSRNEILDGGESSLVLETGRDPRVVSVPSYAMGLAGSSYVFQLSAEVDGISNTVNATVEVVSGAVVAAISGGTKQTIGSSQVLSLNASASRDEDGLDTLPFEYTWSCEDESGETCVSQGGTALDVAPFATDELLTLPAETLPTGVDYTFTMTASKGFSGGPLWSRVRSDNASCVVSTSAQDVPLVSVTPKEVLHKYDPSSRVVLYGCASAAEGELCSSRTTGGLGFEWEQVEGNLDLRAGWGAVFSTPIDSPTLVIRADMLTPSRSYTFALVATNTTGSAGYAEFSFETNSPPVGGYIISDLISATAGVDSVSLQSISWTDDFDDLPVSYAFGYAHGHKDIDSVTSGNLVTMLSSKASPSNGLSTYIPPGTAEDGFNVTAVVLVSDNLGSTGVTSLGEDGMPVTIVSTSPGETEVVSLLPNISVWVTAGDNSVRDPEDVLRDASTFSAVLGLVEPSTAEYLEAIRDVQGLLVVVMTEAYFDIDSSTSAAMAGMDALAGALTLYANNSEVPTNTSAAVLLAVSDILDVSTEDGQMLGAGVASSALQTVSVLLNMSSIVSTAGDPGFNGKADYLSLLGEVGNAVAVGSEAGEDVDEVSSGYLDLKAAKAAEASISSLELTVGGNDTRASFEYWLPSAEASDTSSIVVAVTSFSAFADKGLGGVAGIDVWGPTGSIVQDLADPIVLSMAKQVSISQGGSVEAIPTCKKWSEADGVWDSSGLTVNAVDLASDGTGGTSCRTYHLSTFSTWEDSISAEWNTVDLLSGHSILVQYGAESWVAILSLCLVLVLFIAAAVLSRLQDVRGGYGQEVIQVLRHTYLARGRSRREENALNKRVRRRAHEARADVNNSLQQRNTVHVHTISKDVKESVSKVTASSVLWGHAWRHLWSSPIAHFQTTLLTRPQHLMLLLADWMSGVTLQAIFYGKSQFGFGQKVNLTAVTALFMIPTATILPSLLRSANTPPSSVTLTRRRKKRHARTTHGGRVEAGVREDSLDKMDSESSTEMMLAAAKGPQSSTTQAKSRQSNQERRSAASASQKQSRSRTQGISAQPSWKAVALDEAASKAVADKTSVYADIVQLQSVLVKLYMFLPFALILLVCQVLSTRSEAEAAGGEDNALLHNMTATLGSVSAILCVISAFVLVARSTHAMAQLMMFQAVISPGLILCGFLLYASNAVLATGTVFGGVLTLASAYCVRLQRQHEVVFQAVCEDDLVTSWSQPTKRMHDAAGIIQSCFRRHLAATRVTRAREFNAWLNKCQSKRRIVHGIVVSLLLMTILCLTYTNLVFAAAFDGPTSNNWLVTCALALVVEAVLQQPVILLLTGVLGDFIEESADVLLEVINS